MSETLLQMCCILCLLVVECLTTITFVSNLYYIGLDIGMIFKKLICR